MLIWRVSGVLFLDTRISFLIEPGDEKQIN